MRSRLVATAAAAVLIAVSGCGGDSDEGSVERDIQPQAQSRAESLVLERADFPEGWRASESDRNEEDEEKFRECTGGDYSGFTVTGEANSDDFSMPPAMEVSNEATVFESAEEAGAAIAELGQEISTPETEACLRDLIAEEAGSAEDSPEFEIGEIEIGELDFAEPDVEEAMGWQIAVPFEIEDASPTVYLDIAILREGDTISTLVTGNTLQPFESPLRNDLLRALARRRSGGSGGG